MQQTENPRMKEPSVVELMEQPVLARLGTSNPKTLQPHVVPVWFAWNGESVFVSAFSSTRKVKDLLRNQRCSILIEPKDASSSKIQGVLLEGTCEVISEQPYVARTAEWIYEKYLGIEGAKASEPQSWMVDPESRIIKLTPQKVFVW
jgi:nitroimidazol reductase NimA-like FMN-containing flavoprotein (pyridoxamine 5'-phosphate oxidase superfamily)